MKKVLTLSFLLPLLCYAQHNGPYPNGGGGLGGSATNVILTGDVTKSAGSTATTLSDQGKGVMTNIANAAAFQATNHNLTLLANGNGNNLTNVSGWEVSEDTIINLGGIIDAQFFNGDFVGISDDLTNSTAALPANTNSVVSAAQAAAIARAIGGGTNNIDTSQFLTNGGNATFSNLTAGTLFITNLSGNFAGGTNYLGSNIIGAVSVAGIASNTPAGNPIASLLDATNIANAAVSPYPIFTSSTNRPKLIYDNDYNGDCGDIGGLVTAIKFHELGKVNLVACGISTATVHGAQEVSDILQWYGHGNIPIGTNVNNQDWGFDTGMADYVVTNGLQGFYQPAVCYDSTALYRSIIANSPTNSVVIALLGQYHNLYDLWRSPADLISPLSGSQLMSNRVVTIIMCAGYYPGGDGIGNYNAFSDTVGASVLNQITNLPSFITSYSEIAGNVSCFGGGGFTLNEPVKSPSRLAYYYVISTPAIIGTPYNPAYGREAWDESPLLLYVFGTNLYNLGPKGSYLTDTVNYHTNSFSTNGGNQYYATAKSLAAFAGALEAVENYSLTVSPKGGLIQTNSVPTSVSALTSPAILDGTDYSMLLFSKNGTAYAGIGVDGTNKIAINDTNNFVIRLVNGTPSFVVSSGTTLLDISDAGSVFSGNITSSGLSLKHNGVTSGDFGVANSNWPINGSYAGDSYFYSEHATRFLFSDIVQNPMMILNFTNDAVTFRGAVSALSYTGNGGGITNVNAATVGGIASSTIVTNTQTTLELGDADREGRIQISDYAGNYISVIEKIDAGLPYMTGNGGGVTNLNGASLQPGTVSSNALDTATRNLLGTGGGSAQWMSNTVSAALYVTNSVGIGTTNMSSASLTISNQPGQNVAQVFQAPNVGWPQQNDFHFHVTHSPQGYQYHGTNFPDEKQFFFSFNDNELGGRQSTNEAMYGDVLETDWVDPSSGERQIERYNVYSSPGGEWTGRPEGWVMRKNRLDKNFLCDTLSIDDASNHVCFYVETSRNSTPTANNHGVGAAYLYGMFTTDTNTTGYSGVRIMNGGEFDVFDIGNAHSLNFRWQGMAINGNLGVSCNGAGMYWLGDSYNRFYGKINDGTTVPLEISTWGVTNSADLFAVKQPDAGSTSAGIHGNFSIFTTNAVTANTMTATNGVATYATNSYPFTATGWTNTSGVNTRVIITGATTAVFYGTNNVAMFTVGAIAATPFPWVMHPLESLVGTGISGTAWIQ